VAVWIVAGVALVVALAAFVAVKRALRKVDSLTQSYWELRYDYTRLRAQVNRLDPAQAESQPAEPAPPASVSFVPLSSIRKKDQ
jgi:hypothetical protein